MNTTDRVNTTIVDTVREDLCGYVLVSFREDRQHHTECMRVRRACISHDSRLEFLSKALQGAEHQRFHVTEEMLDELKRHSRDLKKFLGKKTSDGR